MNYLIPRHKGLHKLLAIIASLALISSASEALAQSAECDAKSAHSPAQRAPALRQPESVRGIAPASAQVVQAIYESSDSDAVAVQTSGQDGSLPPVAVSEAEQVARLTEAIASDEKSCKELHAELNNPHGEFSKAEVAFKTINEQLEQLKTQLAKLREAGNAREIQSAEADLEDLEKKRTLARERFDLAIQTRKTLQQQIAALDEKLQQERAALDKLTGVEKPTPSVAPAADAVGGATTAVEPQSSSAPAELSSGHDSGVSGPMAELAGVAQPSLFATSSGETSTSAEEPRSSERKKPVSKELTQAQQQAQIKKEEARTADADAQSISERIAAQDRNLSLEQKLFESARKKADIAYQTRTALAEEYERKSSQGAPRGELSDLMRKMREADDLFRRSREEESQRTDRLTQLQSQRADLQAEELAALGSAKEKQRQADQAAKKVNQLQNPFSPHNLLQWLLDHGPKVATIVVLMFVLRWLSRIVTRRMVALMVKGGARGSREEYEDRAKTLAGVFQNAVSLTLIAGGTLMICQEVGVAVGPLMGGAAVVGLAAAFGAQNLIRDYFYGFVILLENQYKINDVLKIGDISGQVERITLRVTVLRDLEGRVHFIPNGKVDCVTNMTHGWSRAMMEIGVAYKEDVDRVMDVLLELGRELARDPKYGPLILDQPEMLGVDSLSDSAVVIKFIIKTRPMKQWQVKREMHRRIKRRFDELGIEIPFPHRTVYHRAEGREAAALAADIVGGVTDEIVQASSRRMSA